MRKTIAALALCSTLLPAAAVAAGAAPAVYLSSIGADGPNCGAQASPCRTLQHALTNVVAPGGAIYLATPGDFGPATVSRSITIANKHSAPTGVNSFTAGSTALKIAAGPQGQVVLDGLTIDGGTEGAIGVLVTSAASVLLQNCTLRNFDPAAGAALRVRAATPTVVTLRDTTITDPGRYGVYLFNSGAGTLTVALERARIFDSSYGVATAQTGGAVKVAVSDSLFMGNGVAFSNGANGQVAIENSRLTANETALSNAGLAGLATSTIAGNQTGVSTRGGGQTNSWRNSVITGNKTDIAGPALTSADFK